MLPAYSTRESVLEGSQSARFAAPKKPLPQSDMCGSACEWGFGFNLSDLPGLLLTLFYNEIMNCLLANSAHGKLKIVRKI